MTGGPLIASVARSASQERVFFLFKEHIVNSTSTRQQPVTLTREYLQTSGIQVLDQNWQYSYGSLDLVGADHGVLVVCAVRVRRPRVNGDPAQLSRNKIRQFRRLAVLWQREHGVRYEQVRVDVIVVTFEGTGGCTIEHVKEVG